MDNLQTAINFRDDRGSGTQRVISEDEICIVQDIKFYYLIVAYMNEPKGTDSKLAQCSHR